MSSSCAILAKLKEKYASVGPADRRGIRVVTERETGLSLHVGPDGKPLYTKRYASVKPFVNPDHFVSDRFEASVMTQESKMFWINVEGVKVRD